MVYMKLRWRHTTVNGTLGIFRKAAFTWCEQCCRSDDLLKILECNNTMDYNFKNTGSYWTIIKTNLNFIQYLNLLDMH